MLGDGSYSNLSEALAGLKLQGYTHEFIFQDGELRVIDQAGLFQPQQIRIVDSFRFEGASNPDDMAVLYVIETRSGLKGTITDAFGLYGDEQLSQFLDDAHDLREEQQGELPNILPSDPQS